MQPKIQRKLREQNLKLDKYNYNCSEPCKSSKSFSNYFPFLLNNSVIVDNKQGDAIWFLLKTLSPALGMVPTWAVYNSLIGQKKPLTNVAMLPIVNGSPKEWKNLYASIKETENSEGRFSRTAKLSSHLTCSYTLKQSDCKKEMPSKICLFSGWVNFTLCSVI